MKKKFRIFLYLYLISVFSSISLFAQNSVAKNLATPAPTGIVARYYCRNQAATALTANASLGGTLRWYAAPTGGTGSSVAPVPSTLTDGTTYYYVTQIIGGVESTPRSRIEVNVNKQFDLFCDGANLTPNSVNFDFSNVGQTSFVFSYTVKSGSTIVNSASGTWTSPSNFPISGLLPGQTVDFTITAVGAPSCVLNTTESDFCVTPCPLPKLKPNFLFPKTTFCQGNAMPNLSNTSPAPNFLSGKWFPATISNAAGVNQKYTFTPDDPCAETQDIFITVLPNDALTFTSGIKANVCENEVYSLPIKSNNTNPVNGSWTPSTTVNTSVIGLTPVYTFKPNSGECYDTSVPLPQVSINVKPSLATSFVSIPPFCAGIIPAPTFPIVTSIPATPGGISGNWNPSTISTDALPPNQEYQFTPTTECATTPSKLIVNVTPSPVPSFSPIVPDKICEGVSFSLSSSSNDTPPITGYWEIPSGTVTSIDTSIPVTETYTFIPDSGQCAKAPDPIAITVNPSNTLTNVDPIVTDAFEDNQIITVEATAAGNYLYQLDSGPLQTSNVFENVSAGTHTVTVSDVTGCSASKTEANIIVIKHPKYFTPNGDGINDAWKITGLSSSLINKIYIFDRYGKLLKEIATDGTGWDGTYLGVPVPADDYWFTVDYAKDFLPKKFKAHFTLKR